MRHLPPVSRLTATLSEIAILCRGGAVGVALVFAHEEAIEMHVITKAALKQELGNRRAASRIRVGDDIPDIGFLLPGDIILHNSSAIGGGDTEYCREISTKDGEIG